MPIGGKINRSAKKDARRACPKAQVNNFIRLLAGAYKYDSAKRLGVKARLLKVSHYDTSSGSYICDVIS